MPPPASDRTRASRVSSSTPRRVQLTRAAFSHTDLDGNKSLKRLIPGDPDGGEAAVAELELELGHIYMDSGSTLSRDVQSTCFPGFSRGMIPAAHVIASIVYQVVKR